MKEIRPSQKNWMYYGLVVMLIMMLLNIFIFPSLTTPGWRRCRTAPSSR